MYIPYALVRINERITKCIISNNFSLFSSFSFIYRFHVRVLKKLTAKVNRGAERSTKEYENCAQSRGRGYRVISDEAHSGTLLRPMVNHWCQIRNTEKGVLDANPFSLSVRSFVHPSQRGINRATHHGSFYIMNSVWRHSAVLAHSH